MPKSTKKSSRKDLWPLVIILAVLAFVVYRQKDIGVKIPVVKEDISQLSAVSTRAGSASATRSFHEGKFKLSITAFLPKLSQTQSYVAKLAGETQEPKTVELGSLSPAGDVFTLTYESETDYTLYPTLQIFIVNLGTKSETLTLEGSF